MSRVSHSQNHLILVGLCTLGGLVQPIPFAATALVYSVGEMVYTYNEIATIHHQKPWFDYRKYDNLLELFGMALVAGVGLAYLHRAIIAVRSSSTELVNK